MKDQTVRRSLRSAIYAASRPTPQGSSKSGAVDTGKQQPWKRKFAARDFRHDAPGIAPENRRTPSETGPW